MWKASRPSCARASTATSGSAGTKVRADPGPERSAAFWCRAVRHKRMSVRVLVGTLGDRIARGGEILAGAGGRMTGRDQQHCDQAEDRRHVELTHRDLLRVVSQTADRTLTRRLRSAADSGET